VMNNWLMNYDYRITFGADILIIAAVSTLSIAFLTVSWQAYRAARANPVDALKYE